MTNEEPLAESDKVCPFKAEAIDGRVRVTWSDAPLDFISIHPDRAADFIEAIGESRRLAICQAHLLATK